MLGVQPRSVFHWSPRQANYEQVDRMHQQELQEAREQVRYRARYTPSAGNINFFWSLRHVAEL